MAGSIKGLTVEIGGDTSKLGKALEGVQKKSKDLSSELGQINRLLKMDPGNADLLAQKQKVLAEAVANTKEKLETLQEAERQVQQQFERGEVSEEQYRALQREVIATEKKLEGYQKAVQETAEASQDLGKDTQKAEEGLDDTGTEAKKSAKEVEKFAKEAEGAEKSGGKMGGTLGKVAVGGLKAIGAACAAAIAGLTAAAESTREYRTEMGKLDAAFSASNLSADTASETYKTLQGIIGETDQSVEAAQQIALLADSEQDAAAWAEQAAGVVGKFGDALQPETFFEAANETMKLGEATGAYTQMLEGCGMSVEDFNAGLAACKTEAEKQAYMLQVTEQALGSAGDAYRENNAELIRANEANEAWTSSLAGVGGAIDPIITDIKTMGASLLSDALPGIQQLAEAFRGLMNGDAGAAAGVGEALSGIITGLLDKVVAMAPQLATAAISLITSLTTTLITMIPQLVTTGIEIVMALIQGLTTAIPQVIGAIAGMIPQLVQALVTGIPQLIDGAVQLLLAILQAIPQLIPPLVAAIPQLVMAIINGLLTAIPQLIDGALQFLLAIVDAIPMVVGQLIPVLPQIITTIVMALLDAVPQLLDAAVTLLLAIVEAIPQIVVQLIGALPQIWETMRNYFSKLPKKLWAILSSLVKNFVRWATESRAKALQGAADILTAIATTLQNLPGRVAQFLSQVVSKVAAWATSLAAKGKAAATKLVTAVVGTVKGIPGKIANVGRNLVEGIWNGISGATTWIKNKITQWVGNVTDFLKNLFGIQSPSTVMRDEIGRFLPQGIGVGIEKDAHYATDALAALSDDMMDAANPELGGLAFERELNYTNKINGPAGAMAQSNAALLAKLDGIYERLGRLQVVLDSGATVGGLIDGIDSALSTRQILRARGV
jgi:phage-related minor tail protein